MILGQVSAITSRDLALALPNNLTGYVPLTSISDQLTSKIERLLAEDEAPEKDEDDEMVSDIRLESYFTVGQYLRGCVTSAGTDFSTSAKHKKHIELSISPAQANQGMETPDIVVSSTLQAAVKSVEDHGLVMDIGMGESDIRGFMSSKEVGSGIEYSKIKEGTVFLCMVTGLSSNGKIIKLTADIQKMGNIKKTGFLSTAPTINSFLPGTAIEVLLSEVTASGLAGKVMGSLDVTADLIHSDAGPSAVDLEKKYKVGMKIKGRLICTFPTSDSRKIGFSLLPQVLKLSSEQGKTETQTPLEKLPLSSIVSEAKIVRVEPNIGLFVDVGVQNHLGFVHISRVKDSKIEDLSVTTGLYKLGSVHQARVVGYNAMDGLFLLSMEQHVIDQPFLRIEDVELGSLVKGKIEKILMGSLGIKGLIVSLADGITGLVPEIHFSDVRLQHPERKFKEGMAVNARVLSTDPEKRRIRLTLKKTLVNSDTATWTAYNTISAGDQSLGTVVKILPAGAVIEFYGNLRGFLPVAEMSEAYIKDPTQHFRPGQVISVHALNVDPEAERLTVSCKDPHSITKDQQVQFQNLAPGKLISATVFEKSQDAAMLTFEDGINARLEIEQFSDGSLEKNSTALRKLRTGQTVNDLVVLEVLEKRHLLLVSKKPSLVKAAKENRLIRSLADAQQGATVQGFIRNITSDGLFVQFAGGLTALLPKRLLKDTEVDLPEYGMRRGQSIEAIVLTVDQSQGRFVLTREDPAKQAEEGDHENGASSEKPPVTKSDESSTDLASISQGDRLEVTVTSVKDTQINVQAANNVQGRIDASQVFDKWEDIKDKRNPLKSFNKKDKLSVRVLGIHDVRNHRFLPLSHRTGRNPVLELTAKPTDQTDVPLSPLTLDQVTIGVTHMAFINNIADDHVWVTVAPNVRGRVRLMDLSDDISLLGDVEKNFPTGSALQVRVTGVDAENGRLDLTAKMTESTNDLQWDTVSKGMILPGRVTKVTDRQVVIQLSKNVSGIIPLFEMADDYSQANPATFEKNQILRVAVTELDIPNKRVTLSTRPSRVLSSSMPVKDPVVSAISGLKVNDIVRGFVKNVANNGLFVSLGASVTAYVRISDLSDSFLKDWKDNFQVDQLVQGKIVALDADINHVQMSLKASVLDKDYIAPLSFSDMKPGQVVTGKVRKVEDFGVFIVVDGSANVSGLCHRSEIADKKIQDVKKLYSEGDKVKAKVLKVELEKRRISFGLKASYFGDVEEDDEEDSDDESDEEEGVDLLADGSDEDGSNEGSESDGVSINMGDAADGPEDVLMQSASPSDSGSEESDSGEEVKEVDGLKAKPAGLSTQGFDWTGGLSSKRTRSSSPSEAEADEATSSKKKKRRKPAIQVDRTGDLDANGPQSTSDFERLLLSEPNSSYLWLQYMAFQLQLSEVEAAREIAERALRSIHIREQGEKMNIWIGLLNLENTYGNDEKLDETFKRACQYNDPLEMGEHLASILISSGKLEVSEMTFLPKHLQRSSESNHANSLLKRADTLFQTLLKKHTQSPDLYLNYASFLMTTRSSPAQARALHPRAMQALPSHTHINLTTKFASLEFRSPNGDPERGRTLFEGLLDQFPKRWDLWNVLLDLEIKVGDKDNVRRAFRRVTERKGLKAKQARWFFKRWLEWEEKEGDAKKVAEVKEKAAEFVRRAGAAKEE